MSKSQEFSRKFKRNGVCFNDLWQGPKRVPRGHADPVNFLDFNFLKSPHRNLLIIGVYMVGTDLETLPAPNQLYFKTVCEVV